MEFVAVVKKNFVVLFVACLLDLPIREIAELLELVEGGSQRPPDERKISVALNVEKVAELVISFFKHAFIARGVQPDLEKRYESLRNMILEFAVGFNIDRQQV